MLVHFYLIVNVTAAEVESYCADQRVELAYYPATIAPATTIARCADNAHLETGSSLTVTCSSSGSWTGAIPLCKCDTGYEETIVNGVKICQGELRFVLIIKI